MGFNIASGASVGCLCAHHPWEVVLRCCDVVQEVAKSSLSLAVECGSRFGGAAFAVARAPAIGKRQLPALCAKTDSHEFQHSHDCLMNSTTSYLTIEP